MRLDPEHARKLLPRVDPGWLRAGRAEGLRDGALIALVAAGLTAVEIAALRATAVTMTDGKVLVAIRRHGFTRSATLPTDLGARLLAWLSESGLWVKPEPIFPGPRGPLTPTGICKSSNATATEAPRKIVRRRK
jgi:hypothetical protein